MPNNTALQTFYGTLPLVLVFIGLYFRDARYSKNILDRLTNLEKSLNDFKDGQFSSFRDNVSLQFTGIRQELSEIRERLGVLENHAGIFVRTR